MNRFVKISWMLAILFIITNICITSAFAGITGVVDSTKFQPANGANVPVRPQQMGQSATIITVAGGGTATTTEGTYYARWSLRSDGPNGYDAGAGAIRTLAPNGFEDVTLVCQYSYTGGLGQHTVTATIEHWRTTAPADNNWILDQQKTSNYTLVLAP